MVDISKFDFRCATVNDIDLLINFWAESGENANRPIDYRDLVKQLIDRDPEALIMATKDQQIKGTVIAGWDGWRGSIYRLAVDSSARRSGLGTHLLKLAEQRLSYLGAQRVGAQILESNQDAHSFYPVRGYLKQEEWRRWVKDLVKKSSHLPGLD